MWIEGVGSLRGWLANAGLMLAKNLTTKRIRGTSRCHDSSTLLSRPARPASTGLRSREAGHSFDRFALSNPCRRRSCLPKQNRYDRANGCCCRLTCFFVADRACAQYDIVASVYTTGVRSSLTYCPTMSISSSLCLAWRTQADKLKKKRLLLYIVPPPLLRSEQNRQHDHEKILESTQRSSAVPR